MSLVLIADDDAAVRADLKQALTEAGHSVLESAGAGDTLRLARAREPDLLLLDASLPDMPAMELLEELRSEARLARVPIMMMAEQADQDILTRTFRWDIVDFINKPFNLEVLVAKIGAHTRLNLAYKFSRRLSKEMYTSRIDRLETQVKATDEDLSEAERHFTWMQPKTPRVDGYQLEVKYRPYGKLGGDFYDFVWLDPDRLGIVVGDVSGHGIQAAILQAMARKLISLGMREVNGDLHAVVEFANRELTNDLPPGSFVAAVIGVLDVSNHTWTHVRCGVPYPMLIKPGNEPESLVTPGGPLGLSKKADWHIGVGQYGVNLEPGQSMLLLSDGIIEIYMDDEKKNQFDVEGVTKAIHATPQGGSMLATICEMADLESRADDDATMISITRG